MSMLDGVSQCWWLSRSRVVNWDAWAAVGTLLAVCVAIGISTLDSKRRKQDQESRAMWLRLELIQPISDWQSDLYLLCKSLEKERYFAAVEALCGGEEARQPLVVPAALVISNARLHELGGAATPLAHAIYSARELSETSWVYVESLRDLQKFSIEEDRALNAQAINGFLEKVRALHALVVQALEELKKPFHGDRRVRLQTWRLATRILDARMRRLVTKRS